MDILKFITVWLLIFAKISGSNANDAKAVHTVCYGDLGCFTDDAPWTSDVRPLQQLPEDPAVINTQFLLHTRTNPTDAIQLNRTDSLGLYASPFNSSLKTVFLIHGWTNDANHEWVTRSVQEILINGDVNVFRVNWAPGAGLPYLRALTNAQVVGAEISAFILFLSSKTVLNLTNIHLVGHDLGAHAASYVGRRIFGIGRITGLDPSTIYFEGADTAVRLDSSDALLVDIVHTDAPYKDGGLFGKDHIGLGFATNLGSVDIYVNNGLQQPGCVDNIRDLVSSASELVTKADIQGPIDSYVCSHMRAVEYFVESINSYCPFPAFSCNSWDNFVNGLCYSSCRGKLCTAMGYHTDRYEGRGVFYMNTQSAAPYCNELVRLEIDISPSQAAAKGDLQYVLIGDVGQTPSDTIYSGSLLAGGIYDKYVILPGSNALRLGRIGAVMMLYKRNSGDTQVLVDRAVVQQANTTINLVDHAFKGAALPDGQFVVLRP